MQRVLVNKCFLNSLVTDNIKQIKNNIQNAGDDEVKTVCEVIMNYKLFYPKTSAKKLATKIKSLASYTAIKVVLKRNFITVRCLIASLLSILIEEAIVNMCLET